MSDVDPGAIAKQLAGNAASANKGTFQDMARTSAVTVGAPDGNETLAWLAGNRMPDRRKGLQPPTGVTSSHADETLSQSRPADPILAAGQRASVLADLHRHAPRDPRVQLVFEVDPVVAEDPSNGNLVTRSMLQARMDIFDAVLTMLGRPILPKGARSRLQVTLRTAYTFLSDDAQVEWARSEVRLEEVKLFLSRREQSDLNALGKQIETIMNRADLWNAARAFTIAAHIGAGTGSGSASLPDLLEQGETADD